LLSLAIVKLNVRLELLGDVDRRFDRYDYRPSIADEVVAIRSEAYSLNGDFWGCYIVVVIGKRVVFEGEKFLLDPVLRPLPNLYWDYSSFYLC
jgi:hypothetical protein